MFKNLLLKKMMKSQLKDVPEAEQEKLLKLVENNPELFQKIALVAQAKMQSGQNQMAALMEATQEHQAELKQLLG